MTLNYKSRFDTDAVVRLTDNMIIGPEQEEWTEYQAWLAEGNTPLEADPIPVYVPPVVPMWAVRVVLKNHNLFDQAQAAIDASDNKAIKAIWEYGNTANRDSPAIATLAATLNLSEEQVDNMFIEAYQINV